MMTQLEMTLLGLIVGKPCHAYQIEKVIEQRGLRERLKIGFSTIYSTLKKMERVRWVESYFSPQDKLPGRRIYSITFKGRELLVDETKKALSQPRRESSFFETGMANAGCLSRSELKEALSIYDAEIWREIQAKRLEITNLGRKSVLERALLSRPLSLLQAEREWIKELMSLI